MKNLKDGYLTKGCADELLDDSPARYMHDYHVRRIFTKKGRSKLYAKTWNALSWLACHHPDGPLANLMFVAYRMGVIDSQRITERVNRQGE